MSTQQTQEQVRTQDAMCTNQSELSHPKWHMVKYLLLGALFGIRLQSFHMYGVIGSAVMTGMISIFLIKRFNVRTIYGEKIKLEDKKFSKGQIYGGLIFGFGWAMTGACPGPMFAQVGMGATVVIITILSAIAGTWVYGKFREQLPH